MEYIVHVFKTQTRKLIHTTKQIGGRMLWIFLFTKTAFSEKDIHQVWEVLLECTQQKSISIFLCGSLRKRLRARWTESCTVIRYPSGNPPGTIHCVPLKIFSWKPYIKSFIDQACSVKMSGCSFFCVCLWTSTPSRSINKQKRTWPISSHLDLTLGQ